MPSRQRDGSFLKDRSECKDEAYTLRMYPVYTSPVLSFPQMVDGVVFWDLLIAAGIVCWLFFLSADRFRGKK